VLKDAKHVGHLGAAFLAGPPADHDSLADVGGCQPDLEPVAHASHAPESARSDCFNEPTVASISIAASLLAAARTRYSRPVTWTRHWLGSAAPLFIIAVC
jgi:hypothetical protein